MKIGFSSINFKSGYPAQINGYQQENNPMLVALNRDNERVAKAKNNIEIFNGRLHDDSWSKRYDYSTNSLHVKFPNSHDGTEYSVYANGKVIESNGWSNPKVLLEQHAGLAKYLQELREYNIASLGISLSQNKQTPVGFGSSSPWDEFTTKPSDVASLTTTVEQPIKEVPDLKNQGLNAEISEKEPSEKTITKSPENKNIEVPAKKSKTTFKEKIANVWKFFASLGQMTTATMKGIGYGAMTAVTLLAGSWLFNTLPKGLSKQGPKLMEVIKHPLKNIAKSGKIIAGLGAAAVFAYHLFVGKLAANQRTAVIDHKLHVGHRDE